MNPQRRRLLLQVRKTVNPQRRFHVEYVDGDRVKYTCKTCGHVIISRIGNAKNVSLPPALVKKLARYQNDGNGATGKCPACTKKARDERYPLSP